jgi:DNA-binding CsgD family transcriptional regulator
LALPVSAVCTVVVCRADRRFDAGEREVARCLLPLLGSIQRSLGHPDRPRLPSPVPLTPRELAVLSATADGLTAAAGGRRLEISARTFEKHLERVYRKLGTRDRVHAVLLAQECGVLPVSAVAACDVAVSAASVGAVAVNAVAVSAAVASAAAVSDVAVSDVVVSAARPGAARASGGGAAR